MTLMMTMLELTRGGGREEREPLHPGLQSAQHHPPPGRGDPREGLVRRRLLEEAEPGQQGHGLPGLHHDAQQQAAGGCREDKRLLCDCRDVSQFQGSWTFSLA